MTNVFESYLALAEQTQPVGPDVAHRLAALEDQVAAHTAILHAMESRIGEEGLREEHRPLVPLYQRWMNAARQLVVRAREMRAAGYPVEGIDDLVRAINVSKNVAEDFDRTVQLNEQIRRGEPPGPGRPLDEVMNELRREDRAGG